MPPTGGLVTGGIARFAIREAPPHQDVHQSVSNVLATWGAGNAYSRLFRFQRGPNVPVPSRIPECDLCTSWKQTGPLEFEFEIRDDAFWPETSPMAGRGVTAQDIVFSYRRQMTEDWPNADLLRNLVEITAVQDDLLRIRLASTDAEFFEKLADGRSVVVAPEAVAINGDLITGPTFGSGPWILEEVSSEGATFEANRSYYGTGPHLDGLTVQFIPQASTRATGVRADILDFAETTPDEIDAALERFPTLQTISLEMPGTGVEVALNTAHPLLGSLEMRQAMLLAWDLEEAMPAIWGENAFAAVGMNVPEPTWSADFGSRYGAKFGDPAEARRLFSDAGPIAETPLTITVGEFGESVAEDLYIATAESLATALGDAGLQVTVNPVTTREFADDAWLRGEFEILVGSPPPISSLSGQLLGIYHSSGPWNTTGFANESLDELIEAQATELDRRKRGELLLEIQDEIMAESQRFYPAIGIENWLWRPRVQDFVPDTSGASGDFLTRIWLGPE